MQRLASAVLGILAALTLATSAPAQPLKQQLVGTWTLVSFESFDGNNTKVPNMEGGDLKGLLILTDNGRMSAQVIAEYPKIASNDRMKTTPAEDKAMAHGVLSFSVPTM